jgi:replicative DNA helicase
VSANIEHALITKVVQDHDFDSLEKLQINASFFSTGESRMVFEYLRDTYHHPLTAGQVPTVEMVQHRFASFIPVYAPDTVAILAQELRREKLRMDILTLAQTIHMEAEKDPMAALASLKIATQSLASMADVGQDLSMAGAYNQLRDKYDTVATAGGVIGIPYPWQQLNVETQGMQEGQFIVIYGRPKSMKTWVSLHVAVHAYMHSRRRVLFYTREMSSIQIAQRAAAAIAGVDYKDFKNGTLQPQIRDYVFMILKELVEDEKSAGKHGHAPCFVITADRGSGGGGVSWLQSKIREVQPDLVVVDGMYLMKDDRSTKRDADWKQLTNITRDIKQTALEFEIPIIGVTQANRAAEKSNGDDLTELAYSDSIGMDADAVFRIKRTVRCDETTGGLKRTELYLTAPGMREGVFDGIVINGHPAVNFGFLRTLVNEDEVEQASHKGYAGGNKQSNGAPRPAGAAGFAKPKEFQTVPVPFFKGK